MGKRVRKIINYYYYRVINIIINSIWYFKIYYKVFVINIVEKRIDRLRGRMEYLEIDFYSDSKGSLMKGEYRMFFNKLDMVLLDI